jgi:GDP-4-dehydro-6-deoxy-D-mannose reductase
MTGAPEPMRPIRRLLITGATGFVGTHLRALLTSIRPVWDIAGTMLHNPSTDPRIVPCDLQDATAIAALVARTTPDAVIHLAGQSNVPASFEDPEATLANNILGTLHLLDACRAHVPDTRLLVVSSNEVYGPVPEAEQPIGEDRPLRPGNPYAVSKAAQEMLALQYAQSYGLDVIVARPFNHIGPGQTDRFVVSAFARQVAEVERGVRDVVSVGNLDVARDFTDARDVCRAYIALVERGARGGVYNIGQGAAITVGDLLDLLCRLAHVDVTVERDPARMRPSDVPVMRADTSRLRAATGWQPEIPLEETLRETLDWWRRELAAMNGIQHGGSGL